MIGYVFYEKPYSDLKGVSMKLVEDFAALSYVEVSRETAEAFLRGDSDIGAWTIAIDQDVPRLTALADLRVSLTWKNGWEKIGHASEAPIGIIIRTGKKSRYVEIELTTQAEQITLVSEQTGRMRFVFTHAGDPDDIVASIEVPIMGLSAAKRTVAQLNSPLPDRFDVYTIPFEDVSYAVEMHDSISPVIPLPKGRYEALSALRRGPVLGPGLIAKYRGGQIEFSVEQGGGPRYDIGSRQVLVALCRRNNPDAPIAITSFTTDELENSCTMGTHGYGFEEIDVYTALLYRDAFFIDVGACKT